MHEKYEYLGVISHILESPNISIERKSSSQSALVINSIYVALKLDIAVIDN